MAQAAPYYFPHMQEVDRWNYVERVNQRGGYTVVIFNNGYCPNHQSTLMCFPYEAKVDRVVPQLKARTPNLEFFYFDTHTNFSTIPAQYMIASYPAVIMLTDNGQLLELHEADLAWPNDPYDPRGWDNKLFQKTIDMVLRINP